MEAKQTPLIELLERVPQNARCRVDEPDGMGSVFIPVGKLCHEAAAALKAALAEPVQDGGCHLCTDGCPACDARKLAEPVQEPVAWMMVNPTYKNTHKSLHWKPQTDWHITWEAVPLYTAPPQRKPLTEEEIEKAYREIWRNLPSEFDHTSLGWIEQGIRYAERAHGIGGSDE